MGTKSRSVVWTAAAVLALVVAACGDATETEEYQALLAERDAVSEELEGVTEELAGVTESLRESQAGAELADAQTQATEQSLQEALDEIETLLLATSTTTTTLPAPPGSQIFPSDLQVGDCFDDPAAGDIVDFVTLRDCDEPHDNEVFALVDHPAGPDVPYPGDFEAEVQFFELCVALFEEYVGNSYQSSILEVFPYWPLERTWNTFEDRLGICGLYDFSLEKLTASAQQSGL